MAILIKIHFGMPLKPQKNNSEEVIDNFLSALHRNGQILETSLIKDSKTPLEAYVLIPHPNALVTKFSSPWVKKETLEVIKTFGQEPKYECLDPRERKRYPSWKSAPSLYLFTTMFHEGSPVRSPTFSHAIPLYLLPISVETRDYLTRWVEAYQDHDSIWIGSGALEISAYKQLADPQSELCMEGREYCQEIEKVTGKPTYFYLMRYYGRKKGEENRLCPCCGKSWAVKKAFGPIKRPFEFRCKKCRLVSHSAVDDNERYAHIGEYHRQKN